MKKDIKILILNGPNLNMLGKREPEIYGNETLMDIETKLQKKARELDISIDFKQSNYEGEIVTWIQNSTNIYDGIIINPAAYTHTSVAILDAFKSIKLPIVEIHLSNIFQREEFRHHSYISMVANGIISGFGSNGYLLAMDAIITIINK
jgi:3-dehydroquinate dehydratase-2